MDTMNETLGSLSTSISRRLYVSNRTSRANTSWCKSTFLLLEVLMSSKVKKKTIMTGSFVEGTQTSASDNDWMMEEPLLLVEQGSCEYFKDNNFIFQLNKSQCNPGYTRLQFFGINPMPDLIKKTTKGLFLSSYKFLKFMMDLNCKGDKTVRMHGPCLTREFEDPYPLQSGIPRWKGSRDDAVAIVCNISWPDEKEEWFTRDRKHGWPSASLLNKIRREKCFVVPVGDPTSKHASLEWRFSFLLAERQLVWNFNDTQIHCYLILKLLIKKYIDPTVPDEISSYHLKTIVFWQSEILGISVWREDQLLHRVLDCLSYLSQCVLDGRLEHYFYRGNNLLRHKLSKSDDQKFVLDRIISIANNVSDSVLQVLPDNQTWYRLHFKVGQDSIGKLWRFLDTATEREYQDRKDFFDKHLEYFSFIYLLFSYLTVPPNDEEVLERTLKTLEEKPPADVHPIYIETMLSSIHIRLGINLYHSTLDNSLSKKERETRKRRVFLHMKSGASLDDLVGKLYLATLHFCLKKYQDCENLILQAVEERQHLFYRSAEDIFCVVEVCKTDLKVIHKPISPVPDLNDAKVETTFDLMFSKEDGDFVPYPLKFECAVMPPNFSIHSFIYAFTLLYMTSVVQNKKDLARKYLDHLAETVDQVEKLGPFSLNHIAYNVLGCCYMLAEQREKALLCYIRSLMYFRISPVGIQNAALYHLAILFQDFYTRQDQN